jgi:alpha-ketoglutarate-dependent taurine dioxygenase
VHGIFRLAWSERDRLRSALRENPVVHLPGPRLGADELLALASELGTVEPTLRPGFRLAEGSPIMRVGNVRDPANRPIAGSAVSFGWHSDMSFRARGPEITMLHAVTVPRTGGDTHFASLYRLYESLDPATREAWSALEVEHVARSSHFDNYADRASVHPLLREHPDSGRPLVFASPAYTKRVLGVSAAESEAILERIARALELPDMVHRWQVGDVVTWDNRAVLHRATEHDERETRELWRVSVRLAS